MERTILRADPGFLLTNGEVPGKVIYLADWDSAENYWQISEDEYNAAFEEQAEMEDYQATQQRGSAVDLYGVAYT